MKSLSNATGADTFSAGIITFPKIITVPGIITTIIKFIVTTVKTVVANCLDCPIYAEDVERFFVTNAGFRNIIDVQLPIQHRFKIQNLLQKNRDIPRDLDQFATHVPVQDVT